MNIQRVIAAGILVPSVAFGATTYDQARVVGVQPLYETVSYAVPREQCSEQRVQTGSGGGISPAVPLLAAVAGGALGSAIMNGHNQRAGGVVGAVFGGAVGYDVARRNAQPRYVTYGTQEVCTTVQDTHEEERISGYRVRYEYLGQTYSTVMPNPPGDSVRVRVDVSPAF
jgi:uncharacterized protein YcfJ